MCNVCIYVICDVRAHICVLAHLFVCVFVLLLFYFFHFSEDYVRFGPRVYVCVCVSVIPLYVWYMSLAMLVIYSVDCRKQSV